MNRLVRIAFTSAAVLSFSGGVAATGVQESSKPDKLVAHHHKDNGRNGKLLPNYKKYCNGKPNKIKMVGAKPGQTYPKLIAIAKSWKCWDAMYVTSTVGGEHAPGSYHGRGQAIDIGSGTTPASKAALKKYGMTRWEAMDALSTWLYKKSSFATELIHTGSHGWYVKYGSRGAGYSSVTKEHHRDHIHFAMTSKQQANYMWRLIQHGK